MQLSTYSTALFVNDINVSRHFYTGILGLTIDLDFGKNVILKSGLTLWEIQEKHIIPSKIGLDQTKYSTSNRFEIYFETENLEEVFNILTENKIAFLHTIHEEPWGQRTIRFFDPDNHLIEIGESMRQFVSRFYLQGLNEEEISKRTSVPLEEVHKLIHQKL